MAEKSKINLLVQILLLASVVFFGITLTNALDRNRCEMAELRKTIAAMPQRQVCRSPYRKIRKNGVFLSLQIPRELCAYIRS